ncbi:MAG: NAD(P)/FAD-dependent oxidoreductase [Treponema sp.]|nr:NAD(P)/FAD-dependent oxidoreductase [Treponema sp.]
MESKKKIVIIGAGISGLSAAIYAQRSGFDVTVCEQHSIPGGMCTSWKRKGYLFEGGIHWLTGSSKKTGLRSLWEETGALNDSVKLINQDPFRAVEYNGLTINLYRDIEKTAKHLIAVSVQDKKQIKRLVKDVKAFSGFRMPVIDIKGVKTQNPQKIKPGMILKMLPAFPLLAKLNKISCEQYADQFSHPGIKQLMRLLPGYSAISLAATLSTLDTGDGGYPESGSLAMTGRMAKTFTDLDGKLLLNTKARKVNIENNIVTGVTLEQTTDNTIAADAVIVTQETMAAAQKLFDVPLNEEWLTDLCKDTKPAVCTFICAGIRAKIPEGTIPAWIPEKPITYAGFAAEEIAFNNYSGYKDYAPDGCTAMTTTLLGDTYDFWKKAKDEGRYEEEKRNLADQISREICRKFPQAKGNIEVLDIATPLTYERYTGAYHGSWMSVVGAGEKMKTYPCAVKNIGGLYFAGHRLNSPGGLPVALVTGRQAAQMVCRQFDAVFRNL